MANMRLFHPYECAKRALSGFQDLGPKLMILLIGFCLAQAATAAGQH